MEDLTYTVLDRKQREVSLTFTAEIKRKKKDRKLILKMPILFSRISFLLSLLKRNKRGIKLQIDADQLSS